MSKLIKKLFFSVSVFIYFLYFAINFFTYLGLKAILFNTIVIILVYIFATIFFYKGNGNIVIKTGLALFGINLILNIFGIYFLPEGVDLIISTIISSAALIISIIITLIILAKKNDNTSAIIIRALKTSKFFKISLILYALTLLLTACFALIINYYQNTSLSENEFKLINLFDPGIFSLFFYTINPITLILIQLSANILFYKNLSKVKLIILYTVLLSLGLLVINLILSSIVLGFYSKNCSDNTCVLGLLYLTHSIIWLIISTIITIIVLTIKMNKRRVFPSESPNSGLSTHEPNETFNNGN